MRVTAPGFDVSETKVNLDGGRITALDIHMTVALRRQRSDDPGDHALAGSGGPDAERSADRRAGQGPGSVRRQRRRPAGSRRPLHGTQWRTMFLDGFTHGDLAGKENIREVRVNVNPFSAEYDKPGFGRVDVVTRSGAVRLHGSAGVNIADSALNARNPQAVSFWSRSFLPHRGSRTGPAESRLA